MNDQSLKHATLQNIFMRLSDILRAKTNIEKPYGMFLSVAYIYSFMITWLNFLLFTNAFCPS